MVEKNKSKILPLPEEDRVEIKFMTDKSVQSFLLAIEVFNKPTIDYRLEGCVFFLCNAWELLLKAKLIELGVSIYYPGKKGRTLTLSDCVSKIMTNDKDPARINLSVIIALRNTATHFVIPEYEAEYLPFLAYNVREYAKKLYEYFSININDYIKTDFLSLFSSSISKKDTNIIGKYGKDIGEMFSYKQDAISNIYELHQNSEIALGVTVNIARVNNRNKADAFVYQTSNPNDPHVRYVPQYIDPSTTHTLTHHQVADMIDNEIKKNKINFTPIRPPIPSKDNPTPKIFTTACLDVLIKEFNLKENDSYCNTTPYGKGTIDKYSHNLVAYILALITDDPDIVVKAKKKKENKKRG